jgi:small subunit ribosomal protein S13
MYLSIKELRNNFYGINLHLIFKGLSKLGISSKNFYYNKSVKLTEKEYITLYNFLYNNFIIDLKLKDKKYMQIKNLISLKTYKGFRHSNRLPVNGQRSKTNAQTRKKKGIQ